MIFLLLFTFISLGQNLERNQINGLIQQLDTISLDDQFYRLKSDSIAKIYGYESKEMQMLYQKMWEKDSLNTIKVSSIIDKYGWLGSDIIGEKGNSTLFIVIQHSDLKTQEKYLPLMTAALKEGKISGSELAILIDRIEMNHGRPQIYGSQIQRKNGQFVLYPILDEENVNIRRAEVGLMPLEEYVKNWKIVYKLPTK